MNDETQICCDQSSELQNLEVINKSLQFSEFVEPLKLEFVIQPKGFRKRRYLRCLARGECTEHKGDHPDEKRNIRIRVIELIMLEKFERHHFLVVIEYKILFRQFVCSYSINRFHG